jgi:hypothetical protein
MFDGLEWLAAMGSHVPDKGEQMFGYYGYYRNVSRGSRKKTRMDWSPASCSPMNHPGGTARTGQGLPFTRLWLAHPTDLCWCAIDFNNESLVRSTISLLSTAIRNLKFNVHLGYT